MGEIRYAFRQALPVMTGFIFLGFGYGLYMNSLGFSFIYPTLMALTIYAGSVEFIVADFLTKAFNPLVAFVVALIVNSRHFFYGLSMLEKYQNAGSAKFFLIYGMSDETFMVNYSLRPPKQLNLTRCYLYVTIFDYFAWALGSMLGGLFGNIINIEVEGLSFIMTALFLVLFLEQFLNEESHLSSFSGFICGVLALIFIGGQNFILVAILGVVVIFLIQNYLCGKKVGA
ncbi:AzlC family ABC transporter permease [Ligilactobacillus equi]|nr:AzlC family ABC transporter permease [Ligilactobacillus equi]